MREREMSNGTESPIEADSDSAVRGLFALVQSQSEALRAVAAIHGGSDGYWVDDDWDAEDVEEVNGPAVQPGDADTTVDRTPEETVTARPGEQ
jgi:hypothetical protein